MSVEPRGREYLLSPQKRALDIAGSLTAIILVSPLFPILTLSVGLFTGLPILYRGKSAGKDGTTITVSKFRTMIVDAEEIELKLPKRIFWKSQDDDRVTNFGRLLRTTSLDEIPQFFDCLRGDLSLVGPRPVNQRYMDYLGQVSNLKNIYERWVDAYLSARPGITSPATLDGRGIFHQSFDGIYQRMELDIFYVENATMQLDLQTLAKTIPLVLSRRGAF